MPREPDACIDPAAVRRREHVTRCEAAARRPKILEMFARAELSLCEYYQNLKTPKSRKKATQHIIGSPVAKRQTTIKGKKHGHWFLMLGVGFSPCVCVCVFADALFLGIVHCFKENWFYSGKVTPNMLTCAIDRPERHSTSSGVPKTARRLLKAPYGVNVGQRSFRSPAGDAELLNEPWPPVFPGSGSSDLQPSCNAAAFIFQQRSMNYAQ